MCFDDADDVGHAAVADLHRVPVEYLVQFGFLWEFLLISFRNVAPMFVVTLLLNGGLNQMTLRCLFRFFFVGCLSR